MTTALFDALGFRWDRSVLPDAVPVHSVERATACFLFGALQQFFLDGNKRTSRFMMNGILLSHGMDAISVPAAKLHEFNEKMVRFYRTKDATGMMDFLVRCHPDAEVMFLPPENTVDRDDSMEP